MKCPFCLHPIADPDPGERICQKCHAGFEVDDREECVFVNPENLKVTSYGFE